MMLSNKLKYIIYPLVLALTYLAYFFLISLSLPKIISLYLAVVLGLLVILFLEYSNTYRKEWKPVKADFIQDISYMVFVQVSIPLCIRFGLIYLLATVGFENGVIFQIWPRGLSTLPQVLLIILIGEFFQYWWHRFAHRNALLWSIHSIHHRPQKLYSINTARFHPIDKVVEYLFDIFMFIAIGAEIEIIYLYYIYFAINGFFQHSNTKVELGLFNKVIASAELHRLHHDIDPKEANHNFGNNTILWDIVFKTYKSPDLSVGALGVIDRYEPKSLGQQFLHPFQVISKTLFLKILMFVKYKKQWLDYLENTKNPKKQQESLLKSIIFKNKNTDFGKKFSFDQALSYEKYIDQVTIEEYEFFRPWVEKILGGEKNVLTQDEVNYFCSSSGTTGLAKYIPMTIRSEEMVKKSQHVLIYSLFKNNENSFHGKIFTVAGLPVEEIVGKSFECGSMSGKLYSKSTKFVSLMQVVPKKIYEIDDYDVKFLFIACIALLSPETSLFLTANPSTLIRINDVINDRRNDLYAMIKNWDFEMFSDSNNKSLIKSINLNNFFCHQERAVSILDSKERVTIKDYWPNVESLVIWTKGSCRYLIPTIEKMAPSQCEIIELGYLSSEFRGTINLGGPKDQSVLNLAENFFEFIKVSDYEMEKMNTSLAHEIVVGEKYYIVISNQSGLYRYFINDIILVTGVINHCPCIEFIQKGKGITNITGEKLAESQILEYFEKGHHHIVFFICLADPQDMSYTLYFEGNTDCFDLQIHEYLSSTNMEYKAKTLSRRLKKIKTIKLKSGTGSLFKSYQVEKGQRDSQLKHLHLDYVENVSFNFLKRAI